MPAFCTCGAQLPADALFCHKCGKPQREISALEPEPTPPPPPQWQTPPLDGADAVPPVASRLEPLPMNFRNPVAVRIAVMVAAAATLFGATVLPIVSWPAAGFFSVLFYRRRTGYLLDVRKGMRMGWLTGILMSLFWVLVITASSVPAVLSGRLSGTIEQQMKSFPGIDPAVIQQEVQFLQTGSGIALIMFFGFAFFFVVITFLSIAGGALGAKLVGHANPPRGGNIA